MSVFPAVESRHDMHFLAILFAAILEEREAQEDGATRVLLSRDGDTCQKYRLCGERSAA